MMLPCQPSHSPELNPIGQAWAWAEGEIAWNVVEKVDYFKQRLNAIIEGSGGRQAQADCPAGSLFSMRLKWPEYYSIDEKLFMHNRCTFP